MICSRHVSLCESTVVREGASSLTHRNPFLFSPTGCCRETAHWLYSGGAGVKGTSLSQVSLHSTHILFVIILMIVPLIQLTIGLLTYCAGSDGLTSCAVCTGHSYSSCCKLHTVNYSVVWGQVRCGRSLLSLCWSKHCHAYICCTVAQHWTKHCWTGLLHCVFIWWIYCSHTTISIRISQETRNTSSLRLSIPDWVWLGSFLKV